MKDRVALVTGATAGIGKAAAIEFAKRGARVVITGRREKEGREAVDEIMNAGTEAFFLRSDVSEENDCERMVEYTIEKCGRLDYAFNNAGIEGTPGPIPEQTTENFTKVMNVNVLGVLNSI